MLTMSSQDEFKTKGQTFVAIFWWMFDHYFKMAAWMYRRWMKTFFFSEFFKRLVFLETSYFIFHLIEDLQLFNSETVGSHSSSDRDSLYVYMLLGD